MKKVLFFAPYFVPRRRVGALRPFKFAAHLKKMGWKVSVVTIASTGVKMSDREKEMINGVDIWPINPPFDRTTSNGNSGNNKIPASHLFQKVSTFIDKQTPLDTWIYLFIARYFKILKTAKAVDPDVVWATGDPWSGLWMGNKISKNLGVPFVADFRDPWTLSSFSLRERSDISNHIDKKAEKRIIEDADKIIYTSKSDQQMYTEYYNLKDSKTATIYNSFDPQLMSHSESVDWNYKMNRSSLHILFFGEFRRLSPVYPVLDVLDEIYKQSPTKASKITIHSFGSSDDKNKKSIKRAGFADLFIFHDPVLPETAKIVLNSADMLLVSTQQDRSHIVPAKLWDYLSVDKPILSLTPNPEINEILEQSGAGVHFYPDQKNEAAAYLKSAVDKKLNGDSLLIRKKGEVDKQKYHAESTSRQLANILEKLVNHE